MSLYNALPGVKVYKPLDANETIEMLFGALEKGEPIVLSVSRPAVPVITRGADVPEAKEANSGAYVYKNFSGKGQKVVLAVSGSYLLHNTMAIVPELENQRLDIKIIAVTSPELFEELRKTNPDKAVVIFSEEDRKSVITLHNGWPGFLYPFLLPSQYEKRAIGITSYLKSGTVEEVYDLAQLSPQDIKEKILRAI
jgi:transketolase